MSASGLILSELPWHHWCRQLPRVRRFNATNDPQGRFDFYALPRNPRRPLPGKYALREGVHGVRDPALLTLYKETLDAAYDFFIAEGRPPPLRSAGERIPVYVFAVDDNDLNCGACMDEILFPGTNGASDRLVPALALPSRYSEPEHELERSLARSIAIHELSHLFNARFLPYRQLDSNGMLEEPDYLEAWKRSWLWLDEGMAVAAEAEVWPGNKIWLKRALDWIDRPEQSLDNLAGRYEAALFVRYVRRWMARRGQTNLINEVWQKSATVWTPEHGASDTPLRHSAVSALATCFRQAPHHVEFCSAEQPDIFGSGFCFDSYFLQDPNSLGYEPTVMARFRERAVTQTFILDRRTRVAADAFGYSLPGLSCRYFRFLPGPDAQRLTINLSGKTGHRLKAEIALVDGQGKPCAGIERAMGKRHTAGDRDLLTCETSAFSRTACDHAVLVVSHCPVIETSQPRDTPFLAHRESAEFRLEAICA